MQTNDELAKLAATLSEAEECPDMDDFIFKWFNERFPDSMTECLVAHTALRNHLTKETPSAE